MSGLSAVEIGLLPDGTHEPMCMEIFYELMGVLYMTRNVHMNPENQRLMEELLNQKRKGKHTKPGKCGCSKRGRGHQADPDDPTFVSLEITRNCLDPNVCKSRARSYECEEGCNLFCKNRPFSGPAPNISLSLHAKPIKGWTVHTNVFIPKFTLIMEFVGVLCVFNENNYSTYSLTLSTGFDIEPTHAGNLARYFSTGCKPNAEALEYFMDGETRVANISSEDIPPFEEVVWDYGTEYREKILPVCACLDSNCKDQNLFLPKLVKTLVKSVCDEQTTATVMKPQRPKIKTPPAPAQEEEGSDSEIDQYYGYRLKLLKQINKTRQKLGIPVEEEQPIDEEPQPSTSRPHRQQINIIKVPTVDTRCFEQPEQAHSSRRGLVDPVMNLREAALDSQVEDYMRGLEESESGGKKEIKKKPSPTTVLGNKVAKILLEKLNLPLPCTSTQGTPQQQQATSSPKAPKRQTPKPRMGKIAVKKATPAVAAAKPKTPRSKRKPDSDNEEWLPPQQQKKQRHFSPKLLFPCNPTEKEGTSDSNSEDEERERQKDPPN